MITSLLLTLTLTPICYHNISLDFELRRGDGLSVAYQAADPVLLLFKCLIRLVTFLVQDVDTSLDYRFHANAACTYSYPSIFRPFVSLLICGCPSTICLLIS